MIPIFITDPIVTIDDVYDSAVIVVDNFIGASSRHSTIKPARKLSGNGLKLWTLMNSFSIFNSASSIIVTSKPVDKEQVKAAEYVLEKEEKTCVGIISFNEGEIRHSLYTSTDIINLDSFLITRNLFNAVKDKITEDMIFGNPGSIDIYKMLSLEQMSRFEIFPAFS